MEDMERVLPGGVQVTALEPARGKDGRLTLRLRTSGLRERSVELVRNMERSRRFANPRVSGENAENSGSQGGIQQVGDPNKVSFEILAEYNPATLEERKAELAAQKKRPEGGKAASTRGPSLPAPSPRSGPRPGSPPSYVAPNPQPQRQTPPRQEQPPGAAQFQNPMRGPNRGRGQNSIPSPGQGQEPSGYDASGLKNHDRNRIPPPGTQPPDAPQENPQ
jgi:type IV pilus assembly protein PilN